MYIEIAARKIKNLHKSFEIDLVNSKNKKKEEIKEINLILWVN